MKRLLSLLTIPFVACAADDQSHPFQGSIERLDPAFDQLIAPEAKIEKLAEGFNWSEGPTWFAGGVLFSDVPENIVYRWQEGFTKAEIFLKPSGMTTPTEGFREQGSNGLSHDSNGKLILCQHGDRRIAKMTAPGKFETIADRYDGKRFSSPNDLAIRKNGDIYFTDPPYGLDKLNDSPLKEMPFNGVYRVTPGKPVALVVKDLTFPNGIAFSPDEKILYIAVSDPKSTRIVAYDVKDDGSVGEGRTFFDAEPLKKPELKGACDGMKVDKDGNVWSTGPGGVLVISRGGQAARAHPHRRSHGELHLGRRWLLALHLRGHVFASRKNENAGCALVIFAQNRFGAAHDETPSFSLPAALPRTRLHDDRSERENRRRHNRHGNSGIA